jgi:hypothetical protein
MNSVLQSLFHLTAFRRVVYEIPTADVPDKVLSIPLNLQSLFYLMQSGKSPCSTCRLTKSFGWDGLEAFVQHDIQEFLRVLITNFEEKLSASGGDRDAIARIFRGRLVRQIKNHKIDFSHEQPEHFYDLSLQVKGCRSLGESLRNFTEREILRGDNKYDTGTELGKIEAEMGIVITELPPVLQIHLKRFEYDFHRDRLEKVHDRFEFPIDLTVNNCLYALYGVLVHSGDGFGGHYYVFLRPGCGPHWYEFNDTTVQKTSESKAVWDNFGGITKEYSAYMLFYVRTDAVATVFADCPIESVPPNVIQYSSEKAPEADVCVKVVTEEHLRKNTEAAFHGIGSPEFLSISVSGGCSLRDLYDKVAAFIHIPVGEFRLWEMDDGAISGLLVPSDTKTVAAIKPWQRFLAQGKSARESVEIGPAQVLVFIKWYTRLTESPVVYVGAFVVERVGGWTSLSHFLKGELGLTRDATFKVHKENETGASEVSAFLMDIEVFKSGNVLILVVDRGTFSPDALHKFTGERQCAVSFGELPATPDAFFRTLSTVITIELVSYSDLESRRQIRIAPSLWFEELRGIVSRIFFPDLDERKEKVLIFAEGSQPRCPSSFPTSQTPSAAGRLYVLAVPRTLDTYGYRSIVVVFSEDGYRPSARRCLFQKPPFTISEVETQMADLIQGRPVRLYTTKGRVIARRVSSDTVLNSVSDEVLRCDIIPADQMKLNVRDFVPVANVHVTKWDGFKAAGYPFFLPVLQGETVQEVRRRLQEALGENDAGMSHIRLVVGSVDGYFDQRKVLKGEQNLRSLFREGDHLLLVRSSEVSSRRRPLDSSVKIYN